MVSVVALIKILALDITFVVSAFGVIAFILWENPFRLIKNLFVIRALIAAVVGVLIISSTFI
ncbi:hypothetical protein OM225_06920 [Escherichia albertii]|uniref:hypothetical protein n=1 Tax=Escherichia albertii TaxID=208962 RepID=UPI000743F9B3|nr:hypothetical protein [Escherichia albertii]EEW0765679.1 hypothetical protein [Escherichia albertii]EFO0322384.1 hypothetical protein [Escherichia albertii]EGE0300913.1 hypothetical protein [Escherichia albertii]EGM8071565.1 hypothetical protein [Escherichia albertii]EGQ0034323.1 hypothetical protein [Escherichia albertii]